MWFKVDDKLHDHRKARVAGKSAMGVWVLAGSWASDNPTGGFIPEAVLLRWGTRRDANALVTAGLWHPDEHDGEKGWRFHGWDERNPDAETAKAIEKAESEGGSLGNHKRWHVKRGLVVDSCEHCRGVIGVPDSGGDSPPNPPGPVPIPNPSSVVSSSSQSSLYRIDPDGLTKIRKLTKGDDAHALKVAKNILSRASGVRDPVAYVISAVKADPAAHRYRRGNPTRETACKEHPGEWADNCWICKSEAS